jgi:hypothetical protein
MNQMIANLKDKSSDRLTALLWCLDKQGVHLTRSSVLGGIIIMLKVFKLQLSQSPFLPFKIGPKDSSLVVGMLGIMMLGSLLMALSYQGRVGKLRKDCKEDVMIALMGDAEEKVEGFAGFFLALTVMGTMVLLMMIAAYSMPDMKALLTALFFQKES